MSRRLATFALLAVSAAGAAQPPAAADKDAERFAKWEKEVAGVEKRQAAQKPSPGGVVFAGSSSVRLWELDKSFPGKGYINSGFGGAQVRDCTHFAGRLVTPHKPRAVVFYCGDNDIAAGRTPEQVRDDTRAFVAAVHKDVPKCRVVVLGVKPSLKRWEQRERQSAANDLLREMCAADPRLTFVDVAPPMLGSDGKPRPELFAKDGLHLSPSGYEVWTAAVAKAVGD